MQDFPYHYIKTLPMGFYPIQGKAVNAPVIARVTEELFRRGQPVNRFWTFQLIDVLSKIFDLNTFRTVLDVGSRDGLQSIEFRVWFPQARVLAFEPHPTGIELINRNTSGWQVELCAVACGEQDGRITFNAVPPNNNMGASSMLKVNADHHRSGTWVGEEIEVECRRLDGICAEKQIDEIDIMWVDVQGAELMVLDGLGDKIAKTKVIATEVGVSDLYHGGAGLKELHTYLTQRGFMCVGAYCHDQIPLIDYIRKESGELDLIYVNSAYLGLERY